MNDLTPEQLQQAAHAAARAAHDKAAESQRLLAAAEKFARDLERRNLHVLAKALRDSLRHALDNGKKAA